MFRNSENLDMDDFDLDFDFDREDEDIDEDEYIEFVCGQRPAVHMINGETPMGDEIYGG